MPIILGGLPGTGKSTAARLVAARTGAVWLRIDTIGQAIRDSWLRPADVPFLQVELVCGDPAEHRRRVEGRAADVAGLVQPDWARVQAREYEPWAGVDRVLDTASIPPEAAAERVIAAMRAGIPTAGA